MATTAMIIAFAFSSLTGQEVSASLDPAAVSTVVEADMIELILGTIAQSPSLR